MKGFNTPLGTAVLCGFFSLGGYGIEASAGVIVNPCPGQTASAFTSAVTDNVQDNGNGTWDFSFSVCNTSRFDEVNYLLVDWELPFFGTDLATDNEAGITNVQVPFGWDFSVEQIGVPDSFNGWTGDAEWQTPGDPWRTIFGGDDSPYNDHTHVLHFTTCGVGGVAVGRGEPAGSCSFPVDPISPGDFLSGFGFTANFAPTDAPYQASWALNPPVTGDPAFPAAGIPQSPSLQATPVTEPGDLGLWLLGIALLFTTKIRQRQHRFGANL